MDLTLYPAASAFAAIVVAHGAGAGQTSPWMVGLARGLAGRGFDTATFDFPYMTARRGVPDKAPVLEQAWRDAIAAARERFPGRPLFIGGKSMGGRISSHVAAGQSAGDLRGLVFFGYPLHPPGQPDKRRDGHLPDVREPMLFVQGSRDTFGSADEIRALLPKLRQATLHEVAGGDHGFKVPKRVASADAVMQSVLDVTADWARSVLKAR